MALFLRKRGCFHEIYLRKTGQFLSLRESTGKQTILAGFPFFEDWGRDTMIALGGCCLAARRYDEAGSILETFLACCRRGLMPNLFPEGKDAPRYNTADASLLFILSVYDYLCRTGDRAFAENAYDATADIIDWYEKGTDFAIRMEEDGLIAAGSGLDQVTWMDVNVDGILPTPPPRQAGGDQRLLVQRPAGGLRRTAARDLRRR